MTKLSNLNQYTIPLASSEVLETALGQTKNAKLARLIRVELDSRKAAGVSRPLLIEDFLG